MNTNRELRAEKVDDFAGEFRVVGFTEDADGLTNLWLSTLCGHQFMLPSMTRPVSLSMVLPSSSSR